MSDKHFATTHPKNGHDVIVHFDSDYRFVNATYDNGEDVDITPRIKAELQDDIDRFVKPE